MARIYVKTDVEEAVQFAHSQGNIGTDQLDHVQNVIDQLVHHKELENFFQPQQCPIQRKNPFTSGRLAITTRLLCSASK